jgi:ribonuclease HI
MHRLDVFEHKILALTLCRRQKTGESSQDFHRNLNTKLQGLMLSLNWVPLRSHFLNAVVSWQGHMARSDVGLPCVYLQHWRTAAAVRNMPAATKPVRASVGRPRLDTVTMLSSLYGPFWGSLALDRKLWRGVKADFVLEYSGERLTPILRNTLAAPAGGEGRFLAHIASSSHVVLGGRSMRHSVRLVFMGDSRCVVEQVNGAWSVPLSYAYEIKTLRWCSYALQFQWKYQTWVGSDMFAHHERQRNHLADALCNYVLDLNAFDGSKFVQGFLFSGYPEQGALLAVTFDGASRGNPGPCAAAAVVLCWLHDAWHVQAYSATVLGVGGSVFAEYEAACLAQKLLVQYSIACGLCV